MEFLSSNSENDEKYEKVVNSDTQKQKVWRREKNMRTSKFWVKTAKVKKNKENGGECWILMKMVQK